MAVMRSLRLVRLSHGIALMLLLATTSSADPIAIQHRTPTSVEAGDGLPIEVTIGGVAYGEAKVAVHYRTQSRPNFERLELMAAGLRRHTGTIPKEVTGEFAVLYYIDAVVQDRAHVQLGSAMEPFAVAVNEPVSVATPSAIRTGLVAAPVLTVIGLVAFAAHRRRNHLLDRLFWYGALAHLAKLRAEPLYQGIQALTEELLEHPLEGPRRYSRAEILRKLKEVRDIDVVALGAEAERHQLPPTGEYTAPRRPPMHRDALEKRLRATALAVSRLGSAAWFLTVRDDATERLGLLEPFEELREVLTRSKAALDKDDGIQHANDGLSKLQRELARLKAEVARVDARWQSSDLARSLREATGITAEMLGRLVEYYALLAERSPATSAKLIATATELAARDGLSGDSPGRIAQSLQRRGLLPESAPMPLATNELESLSALRAKIAAARQQPDGDLEALHREIDTLPAILGPALYAPAGLAEAVAIHRSMVELDEHLDRSHLSYLDSLIDAVFEWEAPVAELEGDELIAHQLLADTEQSMRAHVADDSYRANGFYLDDGELAAIAKTSPTPRDVLIVREATCRNAIDHLAQRHARKRLPEGTAPSPLPRVVAQALLRHSSEVERDLHDRIERHRMHDEDESAQELARIQHRLSRARLGLALLGDIPID